MLRCFRLNKLISASALLVTSSLVGGGPVSGSDTRGYVFVLSAADLDSIPRVMERGNLDYPLAMRPLGVTGSVRLKIIIDQRGEVKVTGVNRATDPALVAPAIKSAEDSRFEIPMAGGKPVSVKFILPIQFNAEGVDGIYGLNRRSMRSSLRQTKAETLAEWLEILRMEFKEDVSSDWPQIRKDHWSPAQVSIEGAQIKQVKEFFKGSKAENLGGFLREFELASESNTEWAEVFAALNLLDVDYDSLLEQRPELKAKLAQIEEPWFAIRGDIGDLIFETVETDSNQRPPAPKKRVSPEAQPEIRVRFPPTYPQEAMIAGLEGHVRVRLKIAADGSATVDEVLEASDPIFVPHATRAMESWRFEPPAKSDLEVPLFIVHEIKFTLAP